MNRRRYFEIETNPNLTEKEKTILHKIQEHKEIIEFWEVKKNMADHHIGENNKKIDNLNDKFKGLED